MLSARKARVAIASMAAVLWLSTGQIAEADLKRDIEKVLVDEGLTGIAWSLINESGEVSFGAAGLQDNRTGAAFTPGIRCCSVALRSASFLLDAIFHGAWRFHFR